jgi:filamentous hemagglutinin
METSEFVEIAGIYGQKITRASINVVAKDRNIIRSKKTIAGAVNKVIKRTEKSQKDFINLVNESKSLHITIGDSTGGGHMFPGGSGKSIFPRSWSKEKILHEVSDIATDPKLQWIPQNIHCKHARFKVEGVRDDLLIRVIVEPSGNGIITAFPLKGHGVFCNLKKLNN